MTVISLNVELLSSASGTEASRNESLARIRDAAEEAVTLTRRLLARDGQAAPIERPAGSTWDESAHAVGTERTADTPLAATRASGANG